MKYRIMKTDNGMYVAQVKRGWLSGWDDIFFAGVAGLVEYSDFRRSYGTHNNRYSNTVEECEYAIKVHKDMERENNGENLTIVKEL